MPLVPKIALTRAVPSSLAACELTFLPRAPIDAARAREQHAGYRRLLTDCGAAVIELPADESAPDCCFVEDTTVVVDELAVQTPVGAVSRRGEAAAVGRALGPHRRIVSLPLPATLDGGDVLRMGRRVFVGLSTRTNALGVTGLKQVLAPLGYDVVPVEVRESLHLKSGVTALDDETVLANTAWFDTAPFDGLRILPVHPEEPFAANILRLGRVLCAHAGFPRTLERVDTWGGDVRTVDISELLKAEAGMTCLSLVFEAAAT
jgi:dimethylargininase